jgi:cytochrome c peroxidase
MMRITVLLTGLLPLLIELLSMPLALGAEPPALPWQPTPSAAPAYARANAIAELGGKLFGDPTLSASGRIACATCHEPAHAFSSPNISPVQPGGSDLRHQGVRAVPSLTYAQDTPPFQEHFFTPEDDGDESVDQGPTGGRDWDGRVDRARDQAALPLFDSNEMANPSPAAVVAAVQSAPYAEDVRRLYGQGIFANPARAFAALTEALEFYQQTPGLFSPFSSKYDAFLRGLVQLTKSEASGLAIFNNPARGNCAQCHNSRVSADGQPPLFTDFGYVALGLPRNRSIPTNADPAYFDLGLCGPLRHDLTTNPKYCGMFKAPTLRNVALKQSFYHNGLVHSLRDAVAFYAERDTDPQKWYPTGTDGTIRKFDDLPPAYRVNVTQEAPFGPRQMLSPADVDDLVDFLRTLTDGYRIPTGNPPTATAPPRR